MITIISCEVILNPGSGEKQLAVSGNALDHTDIRAGPTLSTGHHHHLQFNKCIQFVDETTDNADEEEDDHGEEEENDEEDGGVPYEDLRPTYTHEALVKLSEMGHLHYIISQNGDGLHGLSGKDKK